MSRLVYEHLDRLGIARERVVRYQRGVIHAAGQVHVPLPAAAKPSAGDVHALRSALGRQERKASDLVLYVSRARAARRRVRNRVEILQALEAALPRHTILEVVPEALDHNACVMLFARACGIVGPMGDGLASMVFAPDGAAVVELVPGDLAHDDRYPSLARAAALHHQRVVVDDSGLHGDFLAPVELVLSAVRALLG
jgi:capsular polysaccharide biosynthesis protein